MTDPRSPADAEGPAADGPDAEDPYDDATLAAIVGLDALDAADALDDDDVAGPDGPDAAAPVAAGGVGVSTAPERPAATVPPAPGVAGVLGAARARRAPGAPTGPWAVAPVGPVDAFRRTLDELGDLLDRLEPAAWHAPAPDVEAGWQVRDVVAHLVGVERYTAALLDGAGDFTVPEGLAGDHLAVTGPTIEALRPLPPADLVATWRTAVDGALAAVERAAGRGRGLDQPMTFHLLPLRLRAFLVVRVFEVWTHTDDIRRAIGEALPAPDGPRLRLMSETAVGALPLGMAIAGREHPGRSARLVLTGPGGGAWSPSLGPGEPVGEPAALIVADVVDFCRLAARRLGADELPCVIEGDAALAADVLVGAAIFAA